MRLIIDTDRRALVPFAFGLTGTTAPDFRQGDTEPLEIVLVRGSGTGGGLEAIDYPAAGWIAKVAIGQLEEKPITGEFRLEFEGYYTDFLPVDATAAQISTALNNLISIAGGGGVTVSVVAGIDGTPGASFLVVFNSPAVRSAITGDADNLFPRSATVSVEAVTGSATVRSSQLIRFTRSPAALATTFSALPAASASLTSVYAWDGDRAITRLKFSNVLGGSYLLTWHKHGGGDYTAAVPYNVTAAGLESIISAFDNLSGLVSVSAVGFRTFDISIAHQPQATGVNGFFVDSTAAVKVPGYSGDISLATVEVEEMLAGATSAAATLEVVIENAGSEMTVLQATATVRNDLFEQTPVTPLEFDVPLGKTEAAGLYLSKAGNLVDIASPATARTNLDVYSKSESDALAPIASETVAGKVELANATERRAGLSTSTVPTLYGSVDAFRWAYLKRKAMEFFTSPTTQSTGTGWAYTWSLATYHNVTAGANVAGFTRAYWATVPPDPVNRGGLFNNKIYFGQGFQIGNRSTYSGLRLQQRLGVSNSQTAGVVLPADDPTGKWFGWKYVFGETFKLQVYNGTTYQETDTGYVPALNSDVYVYVVCWIDGAGTAYIEITKPDGSVVTASRTGAPTGGAFNATSSSWLNQFSGTGANSASYNAVALHPTFAFDW